METRSPERQCYMGYGAGESACKLSTFARESTIPLITDVNDDLSNLSHLAAFERHGVTQYRGSICSQENFSINIEDVESNSAGQALVNAANLSYRGEKGQMRDKANSIQVGSLQLATSDQLDVLSLRQKFLGTKKQPAASIVQQTC